MNQVMAAAFLATLLLPGTPSETTPPDAPSTVWSISEITDAMTDVVTRIAETVNADGHQFKIWRASDGRVWAGFRLSETSAHVLGTTLPMYRVDKLEAEQVKDLGAIGPPGTQAILGEMVNAAPRWVHWVVFHGEGPANSGTLRNIMDGEKLVVRYFPAGGGYLETEFLLSGAALSVAEAIGIPQEADLVAAQQQIKREALLREETNRCLAKSTGRGKCLARIADCMKHFPQGTDALASCISK